jgi:hypothetical protein
MKKLFAALALLSLVACGGSDATSLSSCSPLTNATAFGSGTFQSADQSCGAADQSVSVSFNFDGDGNAIPPQGTAGSTRYSVDACAVTITYATTDSTGTKTQVFSLRQSGTELSGTETFTGSGGYCPSAVYSVDLEAAR